MNAYCKFYWLWCNYWHLSTASFISFTNTVCSSQNKLGVDQRATAYFFICINEYLNNKSNATWYGSFQYFLPSKAEDSCTFFLQRFESCHFVSLPFHSLPVICNLWIHQIHLCTFYCPWQWNWHARSDRFYLWWSKVRIRLGSWSHCLHQVQPSRPLK